jgi:hypothetical protein
MNKKLTEDDYCEHCEDNVYVESCTEIELMCDDGIPRPYEDYWICEKCLEELKNEPEYKEALEWNKKNGYGELNARYGKGLRE